MVFVFVSGVCGGRTNPCRPKWSGAYLIIHLTLCLGTPPSPAPPRPPAPRPFFFPRPWVRLPRSLRVLLTMARRLLEEHALEGLVDLGPPGSQVPAVVLASLDRPEAPPGGSRPPSRSLG